MTRGFDFADYARTIQRTVVDALAGAQTAANIGGVMALVTALAEKTLTEHLDAEERSHIACRAGCGTCCVVNVAVLFPEAVAIADYLKRHFSGEGLEKRKARIDELYMSGRWLDDEERIFLRHPCAFLDEAGACVIYPVRPLMCRSVTSTDPEACRQAIALPALGEKKPVLMNLFQKSLMNATFEGLGRALEQLGLDARGVKLTETVKHLLDEPKLAEGWVAGRRMRL